jgi:predicted phage terminase large subunit-like protein
MKFYQDNEAAMLEGVVTLWPERWQYVDLIIKKIESHSAFQSEQQNDPVDPRTQIFDIENFSYWDKEYPSVEALLIGLGKELRIFASCDPSIGKNPDRGDYSAIIVVAWHQLSKAAYLLEADIKRRKSNETVKAILDLHRRYYFEQIAVEANSGQEYLIQNLESTARDSKTPIRIFPVTNTKNKNSRIESLQSYTALGMIKFCRKHKLLLEQLQEFPKGKHDDGPDALQMAMELTFARMNNAIDLSVWVNAEEPKRSRSSSLLASLGWR